MTNYNLFSLRNLILTIIALTETPPFKQLQVTYGFPQNFRHVVKYGL
jgi:hypothetical protein